MRQPYARTAGLAVLLLAAPASLATAAGPEALAAKRDDGIWKSATPRKGMTGEFGSHDPIGLAAGVAIKADCSMNWVDPDDHKLYCFNSATAVEYFRQWPKANIRRARARWEVMRPMN
jgi:hypothetical protein